MNKNNEPKYRWLNMNLSEAKNYLGNLKKGIIKIELNKDEAKLYSSAKSLTECKDEKSFLETMVIANISLTEHFDKLEFCKRKGHLGEKVLSCDSSGKALCYCNSCGDMYDRLMNLKEQRDFNKLIKTPMTI